jgi:hypothetical protein
LFCRRASHRNSIIASSQAVIAPSQNIAARSNASTTSFALFPQIVVSEILGHVVTVVLFLGQRQLKDPLGLPDQCHSSLNFLAARIIHARPPSETDYDFRRHDIRTFIAANKAQLKAKDR